MWLGTRSLRCKVRNGFRCGPLAMLVLAALAQSAPAGPGIYGISSVLMARRSSMAR